MKEKTQSRSAEELAKEQAEHARRTLQTAWQRKTRDFMRAQTQVEQSVSLRTTLAQLRAQLDAVLVAHGRDITLGQGVTLEKMVIDRGGVDLEGSREGRYVSGRGDSVWRALEALLFSIPPTDQDVLEARQQL